MSRPVELQVYDLSSGYAKALSPVLIGKQIEAIWHTGVVVGGTEYFFGQGVQQCPQHLSPFGQPHQTLFMGNTEVPDEMIRDFIEDVMPMFNAATYNLLSNNCNNFSDSLCDFLVGKNIPEHILGLPQEVMDAPRGRELLQMVQVALENRFSSFTASGMPPLQGAAQVGEPAPPSCPQAGASTAPAGHTLPPVASREAVPASSVAPIGSALGVQAEHSKEEYQAALLREFQRAQECGIQGANAAAAAAIRRVAELVQSGAVMPPQLCSTATVVKE